MAFFHGSKLVYYASNGTNTINRIFLAAVHTCVVVFDGGYWYVYVILVRNISRLLAILAQQKI